MASRTKRLPSDTRYQGESNGGKISTRYADLVTIRQPYLDRARDCARLTLPSLIPPQSYPAVNQRFPTPYQSLGARGVNHLASKLMTALYPPNTSFFRFRADDRELLALMQSDKNSKGIVDEASAQLENACMADFERASLRPKLTETKKHLLVGGNATLYVDPETGQGKLWPLSRFVCKRDPSGNLLEWIGLEYIDEDALDEEQEAAADKSEGEPPEEGNTAGSSAPAPGTREAPKEVYTRVWREGKWWHVEQEVDGACVEGSKGRYALDELPWLVLRFTAVDGEDYGRGFVEEYYGDLSTLEKLTKAMTQFAAVAAKVILFLKPNATTKVKQLTKAQSGDVIQGQRSDLEAFQLEKYADFQVAEKVAAAITERLSHAFLLLSAVQRKAERVTAEEVRLMAQELDAGLSGVHATLAQEEQLPLVRILLANAQRGRRIPRIPKLTKMLRASIVTGVEALGRGQDLQNLIGALSILGQYPAFVQRLNIEEFMSRVFAASNVDTANLIIPAEVIQQQQEQAQMAATMGPAGAEAVKAYARHSGAVAAQQQQQQVPVEAATPAAVSKPI